MAPSLPETRPIPAFDPHLRPRTAPATTRLEPAVGVRPERVPEPAKEAVPSAEPTELVHTLSPPTSRRATRRVVRLSPRSVFRVSLVIYLAILVAFLLAGTTLYLVLQGTGTLSNLENFFEEISGYEKAQFLFAQALLFFTVLGLVWVVVATVGTTLLAVLYNRASRLVGGIRVVTEDEDDRKRPSRRSRHGED